jgi:DNA primase
MYDGDDAGIKASFRGIDLVLEEGMNVRTVLFPDGEDPDSYSKKLDEVEFQEFIESNSKDFIQFKTELLVEETKGDPVKTAGLIKDIIGSISLIPDPITRNLYVRECGSIMQMEEEVLMMELNRKRRRNWNDKRRREGVDTGYNEPPLPEEPIVTRRTNQKVNKRNAEFQERDIVRILMLFNQKSIEFDVWDEEEEKVVEREEVNIVDHIVTEITEDEITFENALYQEIFNEFATMLDQDQIPTEQHFVHHINPDVSSLAVNFFSTPYSLSERWKEHNIIVTREEDVLKRSIESSLMVLKLRKLEKMISETREAMKGAEEDGLVPLMEKLNRQLSVRKSLAKEIGSTVLK